MESKNCSDAASATLPSDTAVRTRVWLTKTRILLVVASIVMITGLALNWSWLTAIGLAPLLLSLAPCAVMCALGLCAGRKQSN